MNGYNILIRDATLNAVLDRQPFVELAKGGTPEVTIMLEYSKVHLLKRWFKALRNGHVLIAACAVLGNIYSIFMVPLTAYLFTDTRFDLNNTVPGLVIKAFNNTAFSRTDLRPAFDTVSATLLYGANQPAWTDGEYAFPEFSLPGHVGSGNVIVWLFRKSRLSGDSAGRICNP